MSEDVSFAVVETTSWMFHCGLDIAVDGDADADAVLGHALACLQPHLTLAEASCRVDVCWLFLGRLHCKEIQISFGTCCVNLISRSWR